MPMSKSTALYCRVAAPDQDTIALQRHSLQRHADEQGYADLTFYEDDGYSGLNPNRPAFTQLEQDVRDGKVARVLAVSLTRLGRNTAEVVRWAVWLRRHGVEIITLKDGITMDSQVDLNPLLAALEQA
jgi:DNA invertase Pin-like site-specific DNA recombinase